MKLLEEALKLSTEARAALAGSLLDSLDDTIGPDAEAAWETEIAQRVKLLGKPTVSVRISDDYPRKGRRLKFICTMIASAGQFAPVCDTMVVAADGKLVRITSARSFTVVSLE